MRSFARLTTILFMLASALPAQNRLLTPADISAGPLFFYTQPHETGEKRINRHVVVDPSRMTGESKSGVFTFSRVPGNLEIRARVDATRFVATYSFADQEDLWFLDLKKGAVEEIATGPHLEYVGVFGGRVCWRVGTTLLSRGTATGAPVASHPETVTRLLEVDDRGFVYTDDAEPRRVRTADWDGENTRTITTTKDSMNTALALGVLLSPSRGRAAVSYLDRTEGYCLSIIEIATGKTLSSLTNLDLEVAPESSRIPHLVMTWVTDDRLRFSETQRNRSTESAPTTARFVFVDIDVLSGKRLAEKDYGPMAIGHTKPPKDHSPSPARHPGGAFDVEANRLFFAGAKTPIVDLTDDRASLYPKISSAGDGSSAVYGHMSNDGPRLVLVRGKEKDQTVIAEGFCYDLRWF